MKTDKPVTSALECGKLLYLLTNKAESGDFNASSLNRKEELKAAQPSKM